MPDSDAKPNRIGGFELLARLGKGGMGIVFKARQVSMDRVVALKVLSPHLAKDEAFVQRFLREARSAAKLNHPNIVQGIDAGDAGGHYYFAMEFVDGSTVKELLKREGRIEEKRALGIAASVASALEHAHEHGIIHRDIKPDNIMVAREGAVKLADLGLARTTSKPDTMTIEGTALGTPYYMAPEQVRATTELDTRADIYALGATLFHMVTGAFPFDGPNPGAIMVKHVTEPVPSAKERNPAVSRATDDLIQHMMAKKPEDRPQTPASLLTEIRDALKGKVRLRLRPEDAGAASDATHRAAPLPRAPGRSRTTARRAPAGIRSNTPVIASAAIVALLIITGLLVALRPSHEPAETRLPVVIEPLPKPSPRAPPKETDEADKALESALAALRTQAAALAGRDRFGEALSRIAAFLGENPSARAANEGQQLTRDILAKARERYDALAADADAAAKAKDFAKARGALAPAAAFGIPELAERARRKLDEIDSREKKAELWGKWDEVKGEAAKLAEGGKFDDALAALQKAKSIPLESIADLIAEEVKAIEEARGKAQQALLAACQRESDRLWALFKQRLYPEADKLLGALTALAAKAELKALAGRLEADQEAARLLKGFWAAVERGIADRKGTIAVEGAVGNVVTVKDGTITIRSLGGQEATRRVEQLTAKQALLYADLKDDAHSRRMQGVFLLAEGEDLTAADEALAAAGDSPAVAIFRQRLATLAEQAVGIPTTPEEEKAGGWRALFDGKSLDGWRLLPGVDPRWAGVVQGTIGFYEHGRIGVGWTREFPTDHYELVVEAMPVKSVGRFCEIVFPVGDSHCALLVGPTIVALDAVDGKPGENNATTARATFRAGQWHLIRLRVAADSIGVWLDRQQVINLSRAGTSLTLSPGFQARRPFALASDRARAAIRRVLLRRLAAPVPGKGWQSLFDGKSLERWSPIQQAGLYTRPGNIAVRDGAIVLEPGKPLTGVLWTGEFPRGSYELTYEAAKLAGPYQFGCVVFPIGGSFSSLTLGAGAHHSIVGLSSVDGKWAGGNLTLKHIGFQHGRWYRLRLRVTREKIEVWLDDKQIVDLPTEGHTFTADGAPKGLQSIAFNGYGNTSAVRDIRVRGLGPEQPPAR